MRARSMPSLKTKLLEQEFAWRERPLVRRLYREWHKLIRDRLSKVPGMTVELGGGFGAFREAVPHVIVTDVEATPWADAVADAEALPFQDGSVANLVLIDVFHHLARPRLFLDEAIRVLAPGGRVVMLDPYCSPISTPLYKVFHPERTDLAGPVLEDDPAAAGDPLASNQARTTLVFFRNASLYASTYPKLPVVERRRVALLVYPLSGGFSGKQLAPTAAYHPLRVVEVVLTPLARLLAFRCLVVLERA
jgi:SAM-dependent methyltransferase